MLFNSIPFLVFLPTAFAGYWLLRGSRHGQNVFVLAASYLFYGWWDWRFLALVIASSTVDYSVGLGLGHSESRGRRRALLAASLAVNLGLLGFFKYVDFFGASLAAALSGVGLDVSWTTLNVVLPVGISFYTFQTLSYTIDVYRREIEPTRDVVAFFAYVAFFPQLVAGPIERARSLLPQFTAPRSFVDRDAIDGLRQILWGLFKKVAVADSCGIVVDDVFGDPGAYSPLSLALGTVFFALQIYGDFSGYSDIAIGTARLFGFRLSRNFAYPYFARDIAEFWRRWHISLTTWFRDYVYIPLGGSRGGRARALRNVTVVFLVSALWHGASWTFVVWGALHALYFVPLFLGKRHRRHTGVVAPDRRLPSAGEAAAMAGTFALTCVGWIFFRATSISGAVEYLTRMVTADSWVTPLRFGTDAALLGIGMLAWEWRQRRHEHALEVETMPRAMRRALYLLLITLIVEYASAPRDFIYFQF